ncbi:hypothetical protein E4U55_004133 [Claviceps digitariae]|nr:hypothetical protein E4U55_004133 [Claviceps digitariae]
MPRSKAKKTGKTLPLTAATSSTTTTPRSKAKKTGKLPLTPPKSSPTSPPSACSSPTTESTSSNPSSPPAELDRETRIARIYASLVQDFGITNPSPALVRQIEEDTSTIEAAIGLILFSREAHRNPEKLQTLPVGRPKRAAALRNPWTSGGRARKAANAK